MTRFFTIFLPIAVFTFLLCADRPFPTFMPGLTASEQGLVEISHNIILFIIFMFTTKILFVDARGHSKWVKAWVGIGMIAGLYVFLEEISYGQQIFQWNTPEYWAAVNDQNETNLHNISSWLDQKPKLILELGIVIGGMIVPLLRRYKPALLPERFKIILPHSLVFTTALLAVLPTLYEYLIEPHIVAVDGFENWRPFARASEVEELFSYYFILLYFIFLRKTLIKYSLRAETA